MSFLLSLYSAVLTRLLKILCLNSATTSELTPTEAVGVEVRDLHVMERPVKPVASPSIELQSKRTDGIASTPELDDNLEKPADIKIDVKSLMSLDFHGKGNTQNSERA